MSGATSLEQWAAGKDLSWVNQLDVDPEADKHAPNRTSREVFSGHYVPVPPLPLPNPELVISSGALMQEVGLQPSVAQDPTFVRFFSGDQRAVPQFDVSWATPYALSIYGSKILRNCPFGTGNGYGDGRAISVAEIVNDVGHRYEFQLKGAGPTPWRRTGDGRAALRSSVREFLAQEFMHACGVSTTRSLSLVVSQTATIERPWYSNKHTADAVTIDDPRLSRFPEEMRGQVMDYLKQQLREPDVMQSERMAMTCRVASSFLRVGHVELFARRVEAASAADDDQGATRRQQLEKIVRHAMFREYAEETGGLEFDEAVLVMLDEASKRFARLAASWIRVGFVQGNWNSDNCLVGGRTMDFGPFGYVEKFTPLFNMWNAGGDHYGFLNQPLAAHKNFGSLVDSVRPLFTGNEQAQRRCDQLMDDHMDRGLNAVMDVWRQKLGLVELIEGDGTIISSLLELLEETQADYALFWRQLSSALVVVVDTEDDIHAIRDCFYAPLSKAQVQSWTSWLHAWRDRVSTEGRDAAKVAAQMNRVNPKYVPREWMLVDAYTRANAGDYSMVHELLRVFEKPYEEQPDMEQKYFRKAPAEVYCGVGRAGTAFMS